MAQVVNLIVTPIDVILAPLFMYVPAPAFRPAALADPHPRPRRSVGCALLRIEASSITSPTEMFNVRAAAPRRAV